MKKSLIILSIVSLIILSGCTDGMTNNEVQNPEIAVATPSPIRSDSPPLELSNTGNIDLSGVLSQTYRFLGSEKGEFSSDTFGSIISKYPKTIVYFYPKDGTPNCTIQALDFSMMLSDFRALGYNVIGISKDSIDSHKKFADDNSLKIDLIQDGSGTLLSAFGSAGPMQQYGNGDELSDIIRSTYIIDSTGKPLYVLRDIYAKGHARQVYKLATGQDYTK